MKAILIVEDDSSLRESLSVALEDSYALCFAPSVEDAELFLAVGRFDAIVLDERLPGLSGTQWLAGRPAEHLPPVILVSANADPAMAIKALRLGAVDCMAKPFDVSALRAHLQTALQGPARSAPTGEPFALAAARRLAQALEGPDQPLDQRLSELRQQLAVEAMRASQGDHLDAARRLGLDEAELGRLLKL